MDSILFPREDEFFVQGYSDPLVAFLESEGYARGVPTVGYALPLQKVRFIVLGGLKDIPDGGDDVVTG